MHRGVLGQRALGAVSRWWRRRDRIFYLPLIGLAGAVWVWASVDRLPLLRGADQSILELLAAGLAIRYVAWFYLTLLRRSRFATSVGIWLTRSRPQKAKFVLFGSGLIGGFLGGLLCGPFVAKAYVGQIQTGFLNPGCVIGIMYCTRSYWVFLCTSVGGAVLGSVIGYFLERTCLKQMMRYSGHLIMRFRPRVERLVACIIGGIIAALIVGPIIAVPSAWQGGPVIRLSDILSEAVYAVALVSIAIIGAFRSWNIRFLTEYTETIVLTVLLFKGVDAACLLLGSSDAQQSVGAFGQTWSFLQTLPVMIDEFNNYLFECDQKNVFCVARITVGAVLYPIVIGLPLGALVGFDAFLAQPAGVYFSREDKVSN